MKNKAFTLIELLVVILVIGIITAIVLPQYQKATKKAVYAKMILAAKQLHHAQQSFFLANGSLARTFSELSLDFERPKLTALSTDCGIGNLHLCTNDSVVDMGDFELAIGATNCYHGAEISIGCLKNECRCVFFISHPGKAPDGFDPSVPLCLVSGRTGYADRNWCNQVFGKTQDVYLQNTAVASAFFGRAIFR